MSDLPSAVSKPKAEQLRLPTHDADPKVDTWRNRTAKKEPAKLFLHDAAAVLFSWVLGTSLVEADYVKAIEDAGKCGHGPIHERREGESSDDIHPSDVKKAKGV